MLFYYIKIMYAIVLLVLFTINICVCDFYVGMFRQNDLLMAQDVLYKERVPYRKVLAKYGRIFKCPITYFRVADRLGIGRGPHVQIIRGGLRSKYLVLRITSLYNYPISVNIYVGCENKIVLTTQSSTSSPSPTAATDVTKATQNTEINGSNPASYTNATTVAATATT